MNRTSVQIYFCAFKYLFKVTFNDWRCILWMCIHIPSMELNIPSILFHVCCGMSLVKSGGWNGEEGWRRTWKFFKNFLITWIWKKGLEFLSAKAQTWIWRQFQCSFKYFIHFTSRVTTEYVFKKSFRACSHT